MEFLLGVFVGGLMVGGIVFAKVQALKAEANAETNDYLTGKGRDTPDRWHPQEVDDTGHVSHRAVVPHAPIEIDPLTSHGESP